MATMRADFLDRLSPYPQLVKATDKHRPLIAEMQPDELRLAIEQPAAHHHAIIYLAGCREEFLQILELAWLISAIKCLFNLPYVAAYGNECPMFWIGNRGELTEILPSSGFHLAFVASDRSSVDAFYTAAMQIGGKDDGKL